jgi:hypothetical protein
MCGSPQWTRFELWPREMRFVRTAGFGFGAMSYPLEWPIHPDWVPSMAKWIRRVHGETGGWSRTFLHRQSLGAKNNGEAACGNVDVRRMRFDHSSDFDGVFRLRWSRCRLHSPRAERISENIPVTPIA